MTEFQLRTELSIRKKVQEERHNLVEINKLVRSEISARTLAEKDLGESKRKYRFLVENQNDSVVKVAEGRFLYASLPTAGFLEKAREELLRIKNIIRLLIGIRS